MNYPCESDKSRCCLCIDKEVAGKPHAACCMCGRQTLKPTNYSGTLSFPGATMWIGDPIPVWPQTYPWNLPRNADGTNSV